MSDLVFREGFWVRADNVEQDLVVVRDIFLGDAYKTALLSGDAFNVVIDVGAHIGTFAALWHAKNPKATIVCVEACAENIPALRKNVGTFATVIHAACTYEKRLLGLLNAVRPHCESTGGSIVVPLDEIDRALGQAGYHYRRDTRPLAAITLEEIMARLGVDHIDLLKLDCEGSEIDILANTPSRERIRFVVGEYHDRAAWDAFRARVLPHWDYGHMYADETGRGLFHLATQVWPPVAAGPGRAAALAIALPDDLPELEMYGGYYDRLHDMARAAGVKSAVEVGGHAGYGSAALFAAGVNRITRIESDGAPVSAGACRNAQQKLIGRDFTLILSDSRSLAEFPSANLVVVDGDHDYEMVKSDLRKAMAAAPLVWCDGYGPENGVRRAVDEALATHPEWSLEAIDLHNRGWQAVLLRRVFRKVLRVAVPSGIGDACWPLVKLAALLKREEADGAVVDAEQTPLPRTKEFLEHFDFVARSGYSPWHITEANPPVLPDGTYNYAPPQPGWHGEYDWLLQVNGHLERGGRLADWLPELEADWDFARRFRFRPEEEEEADAFAREVGGRYVVMFAASEAANTTAGHNRGPLWAPRQWAELCALFLEDGVRPVFVGAEWDGRYFDIHLQPVLPAGVLSRVACWPIGTTFAVIQRSAGLVAYQSGLGIFAVYLGVACAMWWRPDGDSIDPGRFISFREAMASAWAPPGAVESGRYLPLIYTRCSPASIHAHARAHWY
jgi:FkbM family methyltransferase